jgi:hypothetical protein
VSIAHGWQPAAFLLPLSLLKAGILFVNNIQLAFSFYDLAIHTAFFN